MWASKKIKKSMSRISKSNQTCLLSVYHLYANVVGDQFNGACCFKKADSVYVFSGGILTFD